MAVSKWYRLTPKQIEGLDKEFTIAILPLGTMSSSDGETRLWEDYKAVRDNANQVADAINGAKDGPLTEFKAVSLLPLSFGVTPDSPQTGTIAVPRDVYESVVEGLCVSLTKSKIKYVVLVARDDDVEATAQAVVDQLNQTQSAPWIIVFNPLRSQQGLASPGGYLCRRLCRILGCNPDNCPP